jgi:catalase
LFRKAGVAEDLDDGVFALKGRGDIGAFLKACGKLRHWVRSDKVGRPRASSEQERRS